MKKSDSAPIQLLELIWQNARKATGDSWRRYNASLQNGLSLAIRSGMQFEPDDFKVIEERYRPQYWMGIGSGDGEGYFSQAVVEDNVSAAVAFEKWKGRKPFLWRGIRSSDGATFEGDRRLFVGAWFTWNGEHVSLTRFVNDKDQVRGCSYVPEKDKPWHWPHGKVLHRHIIKREELLAVRSVAKQEKKASIADQKKMGSLDYLNALLAHSVGHDRAAQLRAQGVVLAFWKSDSEGKPCNSGTGGPRRVGMVEEEKGPLIACQKGALHATMKPDRYQGSRLWVVALYPPVKWVDGEKYASLKREILAEVKTLPSYKELMPLAAMVR